MIEVHFQNGISVYVKGNNATLGKGADYFKQLQLDAMFKHLSRKCEG